MTDIFMTKMIPIGLMTSEYAKKLEDYKIDSWLYPDICPVTVMSDKMTLIIGISCNV